MKLLEYNLVLPTKNTPFSIYPFGCIHKDNPGHAADHWRDLLQEIKQNKHCVAIGGGDYMDFLRTHAREFLRAYPHDRNSFDALHSWREEEAEKFAHDLEPIKDKLIGLSLGNHHHEFPSGENDVQWMCRQLKVPYLGLGSFIRLNVSTPGRSAHATLTILHHHGSGIGGGATYGGDINAMENKAKGWDFDILILYHNHKKFGTVIPSLTIPKRGAMKLVERPKAYIRGGCMMRGFVPDCITYAESKLMNPTAIGGVRLDVIFRNRYNAEKYKAGEYQIDNLRYDFKVTY